VQPPITKPTTAPASYNGAIGYLRPFVTILVLAHHAVLAYHPFLPAPSASITAMPRLWQAFPVLDTQRWTGFVLFAGFNDTFFMSLMFFLSGLFVWRSLQSKGAAGFLRDRALRLGLPFVIAAALIAPVAYYPAYLQTGQRGLAGYWHAWMSLGNWPAGPAWFIWVLLAFDSMIAALFLIMPRWGDVLGRFLSGPLQHPVIFFLFLVAVSSIAYVPLALVVSPLAWTGFGPFAFQTSRIVHYFAYLLIAVGAGAYGIDRGLLAPGGKLARRWPLWVGVSLLTFCLSTIISIMLFSAKSPQYTLKIIGDFAFTFSCAASCFAFLALFVRFSKKANTLGNSLRDNAYGMYLIHYAFVTWLQYALLKTELPALAKGFVVFGGTLALSWMATVALRRIPAVARVI
jgi:hypothetical protein